MIYFELFLKFFRIGLFTFGGGYAMLPLIQTEVQRSNWMPLEQIVDFIAVSESTPGPFAVNIATYVGSVMGGILGALCATLGVILPSFIIILLIAGCYEKFKSSSIVLGCMNGLKPAVIGLIASAILSIGNTVFFPAGISTKVFSSYAFICSAAIFLLMLLLEYKKLHPILIIVISAILGIIIGYLKI